MIQNGTQDERRNETKSETTQSQRMPLYRTVVRITR